MTGLNKTLTLRETALAATREPPPDGDFVWDGTDEDERPLSQEEMQAGVAADRKRRGRPAGSGHKEQVAIRLDRDILTAFRASGEGWQTRMNAALREWLETHAPG